MTLSPRQRLMLYCSTGGADRMGVGVPMICAADWRTARALERQSLGWIDGAGQRRRRGERPARFTATRDGARLVAKPFLPGARP